MIFIIGAGFDMLYGIGFGYPWQYILVDIIYLIFFAWQQQKIYQRNLCSVYHSLFVYGWIIIIFALAYYLYINDVQVHTGNNSFINIFFWACGLISGFIWIVLWIPQLSKHFLQKQANGYAVSFWVIGIAKTMADLTSAIIFHYTWINFLIICFSIIIHCMILFQVYYYQNKSSLSACR